MAEITIENIPEVVEVLGNSDHIVVNPKVVSSLEGEIGKENANFEFSYKIEKKLGGVLVSGNTGRSDPSGSLDLTRWQLLRQTRILHVLRDGQAFWCSDV